MIQKQSGNYLRNLVQMEREVTASLILIFKKKDDKLVQKKSELTELFNSYFVNIATNLKERIIPSDLEILRTFVTSKVPTNTKFSISLTNETFVRKFWTNLSVNKSTGLDNNIGPKSLY